MGYEPPMRWIQRLGFLAVTGAAVAAGCGDEGGEASGVAASASSSDASTSAGTSASGTGGGTTSSTSSGSSGGGGASGDDPDCAVLSVLQAKCWSCHATTEHDDSDLKLVTYEDLTAESPDEPSMTNAEYAVVMMTNPADPMPPSGDVPATAADVAAFQAWIDAGYPKSDCGTLADDPYEVAAACASGELWNPLEAPEETMYPGRECNPCHNDEIVSNGGDPPIFDIAGTVFANPFAPDDCLSPETEGAQVEVIDANGTPYLLEVGPTGNFSLQAPGFAYPYTARVIYQGRERWMTTAQSDADCNHCHTATGDDLVPGRVLLP